MWIGLSCRRGLVGKVPHCYAPFGLKDVFGESSEPELLFSQYGMNTDNIVSAARGMKNAK